MKLPDYFSVENQPILSSKVSFWFTKGISKGIWFSVFAKNTNGFSDLISDVVFGFSN